MPQLWLAMELLPEEPECSISRVCVVKPRLGLRDNGKANVMCAMLDE
jgi:hypothetical protein